MKRTALFLDIVLFLVLISVAYAQPVPQGIDGRIFALDGISVVEGNLQVSIKNMDTGQQLSGISQGGKYSAVLNWEKGVMIEISISNEFNSAVRSLTLDGVMHNVDVFFNDTIPNLPPEITTEPLLNGTTEELYYYDVNAEDPNQDVLAYSLLEKPNGMSINNESGLINWIPEFSGNYSVVVGVTDGEYEDTQQFIISVQKRIANETNLPPLFLSSPPTTAQVLRLYRYDIRTIDPENDSINLSILQKPQTMFFWNDKLYWIPLFRDRGVHLVELKAVDEYGNEAFQSFNISVRMPTSSFRYNLIKGFEDSSSIDSLQITDFHHGDDAIDLFVQESEESASKGSFEFQNEIIPVREIVTEDLSENTLKIYIKTFLGGEVQKLDRQVYKYLSIEGSNSVSGNSKIVFQVDKNWIESREMNPENIVLLRYTDRWEELPTSLVNEGETYVYESTTPGFSLFAISHKADEKPMLPEPNKVKIETSYILFGKVEVENGALPNDFRVVAVNTRTKESFSSNIKEIVDDFYAYQITLDGEVGDSIEIYGEESTRFLIKEIELGSQYRLNEDLEIRKIVGIFRGTGYVVGNAGYVDYPHIAIAFILIIVGLFLVVKYRRKKK